MGTVKVAVSLHLSTPPIITPALIVEVPGETAVAVELYGFEESDPGETVARLVFEDVKLTEPTDPFEGETDAVKSLVSPIITVGELGVRLTVQLGVGAGVGVDEACP